MAFMSKSPQINSTYISPRLKDCLQEAEHCQVTTIVASMGSGKSTAVRWWMEDLVSRQPNTLVLWQTLTGSGVTAFWRGFCRALRPLPALAEQMKVLGYPGERESILLMGELLEDALEYSNKTIYYVLDDIHFFTQTEFSELLTLLIQGLPRQVHLVLLSRNRIFRQVDRFRLGVHLYQITMEELRLGQDEIVEYATLCGVPMDESQAEELYRISEGWVSLLYLLFRSYVQRGRWEFKMMDIFQLMDQVMYQPLDERKQRFLLVNGVTEAFTREQAMYLWQEDDGGELLDALTQENAFISHHDEGDVYRYHNMLRTVVNSHFKALTAEEQVDINSRLGYWFMERREYTRAAEIFYSTKDWQGLLDALAQDRSKSFGGEYAPMLAQWTTDCPRKELLKRPDALLVLMLNLYTGGNIPEMLRLYDLFRESLEINTTMEPQERNNMLGEVEIMLSFLEFNDIAAMSAHHRRACELMDRPSYSMGNESPWTFGSPSVLMLYHRTAGALDEEMASMRECMPYYTRITEDHGMGAECITEGEISLLRGDEVGCEIAYREGLSNAALKEQFSIMVAGEFLAARTALFTGKGQEVFTPLEGLIALIKQNCQYVLLLTIDMCKGWLYALLGCPEEAPEWLMWKDSANTIISPAVPVYRMVVNQLLLAKEAYGQVVSAWEELHELCERLHYLLCDIYIHLQTAAAYYHLKRPEEGDRLLSSALKLAMPDRIYLPFVEVDDCLVGHIISKRMVSDKHIGILKQLRTKHISGRELVCDTLGDVIPERDTNKSGLSPRELEIVKLAALGKSNQEIAEIFFLSDRTIKNHLNRAYDKLGISGADRRKREKLALLLSEL